MTLIPERSLFLNNGKLLFLPNSIAEKRNTRSVAKTCLVFLFLSSSLKLRLASSS